LLVEAVLDEKVVNRKKFVLVKFLGHNSRFNRWLPAENITRQFAPDPQTAVIDRVIDNPKPLPAPKKAVKAPTKKPAVKVAKKAPVVALSQRPVRAVREKKVPAWLLAED
jgi:hypothetical protein